MLLEVPLFAENQFSMHQASVSRTFKRLVDYYDSKAFHVAPEQYRDHVMVAARALNKSNWRQAVDCIMQINCLKKLPEFHVEGERNLKLILTEAFKEAALKAFLFRGIKTYQAFSINSVTQVFDMPRAKIMKHVSKLVLQNRLQMHIEPAKAADSADDLLLVLDDGASDIKELQQVCLQYVSQIKTQVHNNEKLLDFLQFSKRYLDAPQKKLDRNNKDKDKDAGEKDG